MQSWIGCKKDEIQYDRPQAGPLHRDENRQPAFLAAFADATEKDDIRTAYLNPPAMKPSPIKK